MNNSETIIPKRREASFKTEHIAYVVSFVGGSRVGNECVFMGTKSNGLEDGYIPYFIQKIKCSKVGYTLSIYLQIDVRVVRDTLYFDLGNAYLSKFLKMQQPFI
jgi:hypothetical protein